MAFDLLILGSSSATPTSQQYPTSQLLTMREQLFLIDCGEGTQQQLRRNRVKMSRIHHVFISHMHGDHYFGLIGLISSFHLQRREKPLNIYGPPSLRTVIETQLKASKTHLAYPLVFYSTNPDKPEVILDSDKVTVTSFPLVHGIATTGFKFEEQIELRKINVEKLKEYRIPTSDRRNIQLGKDWVNPDGTVISNSELTFDPPRPLSYAFCSDTMLHLPNAAILRGVDLLYHESTFTNKERELAEQTKHSTAEDAATMAKEAHVRMLVLGHYSSRYPNQNVHLAEAIEIFPSVTAGIDNLRIHTDHTTIDAIQE